MKKHEKEKEFMKSLKSVSVTTSYCGAVHDTDSELESSDSESSEEELSEPDNCIPNSTDTSDDESGEEMSDNPFPLYFLYDCEGTVGSIYKDHMVEIAAVLQPLPSNLPVNTKLPTTFQSLVKTSKWHTSRIIEIFVSDHVIMGVAGWRPYSISILITRAVL